MRLDLERILAYRAAGMPWETVARTVGVACTGDVLRKRVSRALAAPDQHRPAAAAQTRHYIPGDNVSILYIPDTQVSSDVPLDHLRAAGRYAADRGVDVIVHAGDFVDYTSLSTYNNPLQREGLRVQDDTEAANEALGLFQAGLGGYKPKLQFITLGNHEERMDRYIGEHPELEGALALPAFEAHGWTPYPFLQPVEVNGVAFAHYFTRTAKGWAGKNPHANAQTMVRREMRSCVAGHSPGLDTYVHPGGNGLIRGLVAGSFYQHDEKWMGPQGNDYWRGLVVMHEVANGFWNQMEVSLTWLMNKYGD